MPFAVSKGARIHYSVFGTGGPVVVLLQGLGLSSKFWFDVPKLVSEDPAHPRRVIAIDNRGTGQSERGARVWTMGTMADDVVAVLDDAGVESAIVVGISMGGMIAQHCALRHPKRVKGLVLLATTPGFLYGSLPEPKAMARLLSLPLGGVRASQNLTRLLLPPSKWSRSKEIFRDWPKAMRDDPTSPATFGAHFLAASLHLLGPRLSRISCPVVVVTGAEDTLIPPKNARVIARHIPNAKLQVLPETGHALFAEDKDLVRRMIVDVEGALSTAAAAS